MAQRKEYEVRKTCYHCQGTGSEPNQGGAGDPPNGSMTCHVCNGNGWIVDAEIWSVD